MADQPPAPSAPAPSAPVVLRKASEIAAEMAAAAAAAAAATPAPAETPTPAPAPPETPPAEVVLPAETPQETPATPPGAPPEAPVEAAAAPDPDRERRRLLREHRRLTERQREWERKQAATIERAAKAQALDEARASGDPLAVLRQLYPEDQITGELYQKLTEHVYSQAPRPLSQDEVDKRVKATLERERHERETAEHKATEEATAKRTTIERQYLGLVASAVSPERYPYVNAYGVHASNVLAYSEAFYKEHQRAPDGHEVLSHFEKQLSERTPKPKAPAPAPPKPAPATPSSSWRNDAPPRNGAGKQSLKDSLEAAKREAGLLR